MLGNIGQRLLHRLAFSLPGGYRIRPWLQKMRGVRMGKNVWISRLVYIDELHPEAVTIGDNCSIGLRTSIFTHFYWGPRRSTEHAGAVHIENDVYIGPHCVILPKVRIGRGSVIKAGTVVTRDVPENTFWGTPQAVPLARVTVPLTPNHTYQEFISGLRPIRKKMSKNLPEGNRQTEQKLPE